MNLDLTPFKALYNEAIDSLLASTGLSTPCKLIFESTKLQQCPNCIYDSISKKSSNRYKSGGPISFTNGQTCPYCLGAGITSNSMIEEELYLVIIINSKNFIGSVNTPDIAVQTICSIDYLTKLRQCSKIIFNSDIIGLSNNIFIRKNDPQPIGLGDNRYIFTNWTRP